MNALAPAVALAESVMTDLCTITRPATSSFSEVTGDYTDTATTVYTGMVRLAPLVVVQPEAGGVEAERHDLVAWLPLDAVAVQRGDILTVTTAFDAGNLGEYRVVGVEAHSQTVRRTLRLERVA